MYFKNSKYNIKNDEENGIKDELVAIATQVISMHSFDYRTLEEAKSTIKTEHFSYCFDAGSLSFYSHNMSQIEFQKFSRILSSMCHFDREHEKERVERCSLFCFLKESMSPYRNYQIEKRVRPDFCLIGNKTIGLEVVELTTPEKKILESIVNNNFGLHRSASQIREDAYAHHKRNSDNYIYYDNGGIVAVGTRSIDVGAVKQHFEAQIIKKYEKYKNEIADFDRFIILADAQKHVIELVSEDDVLDVLDGIEGKIPKNGNLSVNIIWADENNELHNTERKY